MSRHPATPDSEALDGADASLRRRKGRDKQALKDVAGLPEWRPLDVVIREVTSGISAPEVSSSRSGAAAAAAAAMRHGPGRWYDAFDAVRRGRWMIFSFAFAACAVMGLATILSPREHAAEIIVSLLEPSAPPWDDPSMGDRALLNRALLLSQSPEIAERAARRLRAEGLPPGLSGILGTWPSNSAVADHLQSSVISIEGDPELGGVARITARSRNPAEADYLAAVYGEEFIARSRDTGQLVVQSNLAFLESRLRDARAELARMDELARMNPPPRDAAAQRRLVDPVAELAYLQESLYRARARRVMYGSLGRHFEAEAAQILRSARRAPPPQASVGRTVSSNGGDHAHEPDTSLQDVLLSRIDHHRRYRQELELEITAIERQLAVMLSDGPTLLGGIEANVLSQARRTALERFSEWLEVRAAEARRAAASDSGAAAITAAVSAAGRDGRSRVFYHLLLGLGMGLVVGIGAAIMRNRVDSVIYGPRDLARTDLALLGVIPASRGTRGRLRQAPQARIDKAYRALLATIRSAAGQPSQAVVVIGLETGVGASTVARNLAITAARAGLRTILVDADLHRPSVRFVLRPSRTVSDVRRDGPFTCWHADVDNLVALTSREDELEDRLWTRDRVASLLAGLRPRFDLIVIDAPPTRHSADAFVLATVADGAVMVARAGTTHDGDLIQVSAGLQSAGGAVLGAVLNGFHDGLASGYHGTEADVPTPQVGAQRRTTRSRRPRLQHAPDP